jgi:hypothetical protein
MSIRKRTLEFLAYKSLSRYRFYRITGLSNGFLDKEGAMTTDKCEKIFNSFPEVNPEWLLTGRGEMLREEGGQEQDRASSTDKTAVLLIDKLSLLASDNALLHKQIEEQKRLIAQLRNALVKSGIVGYDDLFSDLTSDSDVAAER